MTQTAEASPAPAELLRLDLGCGKNKRQGFHGVDAMAFEGVDTVFDLVKPIAFEFDLLAVTGETVRVELPPAGPLEYEPWPWANESVSEAHCFPGSQSINTPAGLVPIERLRVGDYVLGRTGPTRVTRVLTHCHSGRIYSFKTAQGFVEATGDHPISTPTGWLKAQKLREAAQVVRIASEVEATNHVDCGYVSDSIMGTTTFGAHRAPSMIVGKVAPAKLKDYPRLFTLRTKVRQAPYQQGNDPCRPAFYDNDLSSTPSCVHIPVSVVLGNAERNSQLLQYRGAVRNQLGITVGDGNLALNLLPANIQSDRALAVYDAGQVCKIDFVHDLGSTHYVGKVYNLITEDSTFFAGGVLTHNCSHFLEHLSGGGEREHFFNELYRVLVWGGTAHIVSPYWGHDRAYGDPTHRFPPISGWTVLYLNKVWREGDPKTGAGANAPHTLYTCDFDWGTAGSWDPWLNTRHDEVKTFGMARYLNSMLDMTFNLTKTKRA